MWKVMPLNSDSTNKLWSQKLLHHKTEFRTVRVLLTGFPYYYCIQWKKISYCVLKHINHFKIFFLLKSVIFKERSISKTSESNTKLLSLINDAVYSSIRRLYKFLVPCIQLITTILIRIGNDDKVHWDLFWNVKAMKWENCSCCLSFLRLLLNFHIHKHHFFSSLVIQCPITL